MNLCLCAAEINQIVSEAKANRQSTSMATALTNFDPIVNAESDENAEGSDMGGAKRTRRPGKAPARARGKKGRLSGNAWGLVAAGTVVAVMLTVFAVWLVDDATDGGGSGSAENGGVDISLPSVQTVASWTNMERLQELADPLLAEPRMVGTPTHLAARDYIVAHMEALGWTVTLDSFTQNTIRGEHTFHNIVAVLDPDASERVVLAAHYDSKYFAPPRRFIGATDSAVPCAMMLDTATALTDFLRERAEDRTKTLEFIFFDGEEAFGAWTSTDSIYGARHLAALYEGTVDPNGKTRLENMEVFILMDLLGYESPQIMNHFSNTKNYHDKLQTYERTLRGDGTLSTSGTIYSTRSYGRIEDDHIPFLERGVPILHLIATPFPRVWHLDTDDAAHITWDTVHDLISTIRPLIVDSLGLLQQPAKKRRRDLL